MKNDKRTIKPIYIYLFLLPAFLLITWLLVFPILDTFRMSMFSPTETGENIFIGFQNIKKLLTNIFWKPQLINAIKNNFKFWIIQVFLQNTTSLLMASLLSLRYLRGKNLFRTILFFPTMLSITIVGFVWQLILSPIWGVAKNILELFNLGSFYAPWLGLESSALNTLALINIWQWMGMPMMLFYAALISIPDELIEAAIVDGATEWSAFWRIKFPLILPVIGMVITITFVSNFSSFDLIYATQGPLAGPNGSTDVMGTLFYRTFFGAMLQMGDPQMGSVVASVMTFITITGVLLYMLIWRRLVRTYEY